MSSKPQAGEFCWNDLMTSNVDAAKEFYKDLLGWTYQEHAMEDSCGGNYTMIQCGDKSIGGIMQTPSQAQDIPPHWMSCISVENLDATIEKALFLDLLKKSIRILTFYLCNLSIPGILITDTNIKRFN